MFSDALVVFLYCLIDKILLMYNSEKHNCQQLYIAARKVSVPWAQACQYYDEHNPQETLRYSLTTKNNQKSSFLNNFMFK